MSKSTPTAEERFWSRVDKRGDCWIWTGFIRPNGYGQFWLDGPIRAHRASYIFNVGPIPNGLCVLHRCDVRACVRPDHLFLGTKADNNADMRAKGRAVLPPRDGSIKPPILRGEANHRAKLTERDVREIRDRHSTGESIGSISRAFGIAHIHASYIIRRKKWAHVV